LKAEQREEERIRLLRERGGNGMANVDTAKGGLNQVTVVAMVVVRD
jgi:hypothetical protein